jgi:hypothetical protein
MMIIVIINHSFSSESIKINKKIRDEPEENENVDRCIASKKIITKTTPIVFETTVVIVEEGKLIETQKIKKEPKASLLFLFSSLLPLLETLKRKGVSKKSKTIRLTSDNNSSKLSENKTSESGSEIALVYDKMFLSLSRCLSLKSASKNEGDVIIH